MAPKKDNIRDSVTTLLGLVYHEGETKGFWAAYIRQFAALCQAEQAMLVALSGGQWATLHGWVKPEAPWAINDALIELAQKASLGGIAHGTINYGANVKESVLAVKVDVGPQEQSPVLLMSLGSNENSIPPKSSLWFAAGIPAMYQLVRQYSRARSDTVFFAEILQLTGSLSEDKKFPLAALRLCNEVAALFQCDQVSLGWVKWNQGVAVRAISNLESFERRANAVWELEATMVEAIDQEAEIIWPAVDEGEEKTHRAHEAYAGLRRVGDLVTLPIRLGDKIVGALTCERENTAFSENDVWRLRLLLEQTVRGLAFLERKDVWFGAKWARSVGKVFSGIFGVEHTAAKLIGATTIVVVAGLILGTWTYRVDGTFILKADNTLHVSSPIDGFISESTARMGDLVVKGEDLVLLDTRSLLLDQSRALAKLTRHRREIEKARASHSLGDMRIAMAQEREVSAEIDQLAYRLANAKVKAPFDGVVVEGDLTSRIGAPVRKGDLMLKVASLEKMSVEIRIDERDIYEITEGAEGEIAFVGRPDATFPIHVDRLVPQALVEEGKNVFILRALVDASRQDWWRPGMSGVAKLDMGVRPIWWIVSHKTIDYLRLLFWF